MPRPCCKAPLFSSLVFILLGLVLQCCYNTFLLYRLRITSPSLTCLRAYSPFQRPFTHSFPYALFLVDQLAWPSYILFFNTQLLKEAQYIQLIPNHSLLLTQEDLSGDTIQSQFERNRIYTITTAQLSATKTRLSNRQLAWLPISYHYHDPRTHTHTRTHAYNPAAHLPRL